MHMQGCIPVANMNGSNSKEKEAVSGRGTKYEGRLEENREFFIAFTRVD